MKVFLTWAKESGLKAKIQTSNAVEMGRATGKKWVRFGGESFFVIGLAIANGFVPWLRSETEAFRSPRFRARVMGL